MYWQMYRYIWQYIVLIHCIDTLYCIDAMLIYFDTLYWYIVSIHCIDTLYRYIVSIHCIDTLYCPNVLYCRSVDTFYISRCRPLRIWYALLLYRYICIVKMYRRNVLYCRSVDTYILIHSPVRLYVFLHFKMPALAYLICFTYGCAPRAMRRMLLAVAVTVIPGTDKLQRCTAYDT